MSDDRRDHEWRRWREEIDRRDRDSRWRFERERSATRDEVGQFRQDALDDIERQRTAVRDEIGQLNDDARADIGHPRDDARPSWAGSGRRSPEQEKLDELVQTVAAVVVLPLVVVPLAAGHLSAMVVNGGWPSYPLSQAPRVLGRLIAHPTDPTGAWEPVNRGTAVPGPFAFWLVFAVLGVLVGWFVWRLWQARQPQRGDRGAQWATQRDLRPLRVGRNDGHRLVVGTNRRDKLAVRSRHSLLVVGPAHSGKTSALAIPALLEWPGPAVVATAKRNLIDETIGWRSQQGDVRVFDPAGTGRYLASRWSLLASCETWPDAIRAARDLTLAAKASVTVEQPWGGELASILQSDLWSSAMATSLAPYLMAAAASGRSMVDVAAWIERGERDEVVAVLERIDRHAAAAHETTFLRDDPARTAFFHVMYQILSVYKDPQVADSGARHEIIPAEIFDDGGHHTLYLTAPEHDQARFRPLCSTVIRQVVASAFERATRAGRPLRPSLLLLLDHEPGVAPLSDLASLASAAAPQGVQIVSIFQSVAQVRDQYGVDAPLVVDNHRAKLLLPNRHGTATAELLPAELAQQLTPGEAALLYGNTAPARVRLRPWYRDPGLRKRRETEQDRFVPPPTPGSEPELHLSTTAEQVNAWLRSRSRGTAEPPTDPIGPETGVHPLSNVFAVSEHEGTVPPPDNVTPITRRPRRHQD